jgi:hypothetical protein
MKPYESAYIGLVDINTPNNCVWSTCASGQAAVPDCGFYSGGGGSVKIFERSPRGRYVGGYIGTNEGEAVLEIRRRDGVVTYWVDGTNRGTCEYDLSGKTVSAQVQLGGGGCGYSPCIYDNLYNVQWATPCASPCESNNCNDNAACTNIDDGSFTCACNAGYSGDGVTCSLITCAASPCLNSGTCLNSGINPSGGFSCTCDAAYTGDTCNSCLVDPSETSDSAAWTKQVFSAWGGNGGPGMCFGLSGSTTWDNTGTRVDGLNNLNNPNTDWDQSGFWGRNWPGFNNGGNPSLQYPVSDNNPYNQKPVWGQRFQDEIREFIPGPPVQAIDWQDRDRHIANMLCAGSDSTKEVASYITPRPRWGWSNGAKRTFIRANEPFRVTLRVRPGARVAFGFVFGDELGAGFDASGVKSQFDLRDSTQARMGFAAVDGQHTMFQYAAGRTGGYSGCGSTPLVKAPTPASWNGDPSVTGGNITRLRISRSWNYNGDGSCETTLVDESDAYQLSTGHTELGKFQKTLFPASATPSLDAPQGSGAGCGAGYFWIGHLPEPAGQCDLAQVDIQTNWVTPRSSVVASELAGFSTAAGVSN